MKKLILFLLLTGMLVCFFACKQTDTDNNSKYESNEQSYESNTSLDEAESVDESENSDESEANDGWVEIYDFLPYVAEFGKDLRNFYENGSMCAYRNEELGTFEIWMISETFEEVTVLRMKRHLVP